MSQKWSASSTVAGALGVRNRGRAIWLLVVATVAQLRTFRALEREMKRTGGPGIIPFELAGSTQRAREILDTWGAQGRSAARKSLLLDYLFPPTYATLQALACDAVADGFTKRGRRPLAAAGRMIGWAQLAAAGFDYVENSALLMVLAGRDRRAPRVAKRAALAKFVLISLGESYILIGVLGAGVARARA